MQAALRPPDCRRALSARLVKNATGAVCSILIHCIKLPDRRWRGGLFVVPLTALPLPANNLPSTPFWGLTFYSQAFQMGPGRRQAQKCRGEQPLCGRSPRQGIKRTRPPACFEASNSRKVPQNGTANSGGPFPRHCPRPILFYSRTASQKTVIVWFSFPNPPCSLW